MHSSFLLPLLAALPSLSLGSALMSGQSEANMALKTLMGRQTRICTPVPAPATCERSCGPGYTQCVSFPNCYNPTVGQTCCSNGKYCPAGYYCTNAGCCPNGTPLSECGATATLSVILPNQPGTTTTSASSTTTIPVAVTTTSTTVVVNTATTTVEETTTSVDVIVTSTSTTTSEASTTPILILTSATSTQAGNATSTASKTIVVQTANAAARQGQSVLGLAIGGMGLAALL